MHEYSIVQSLLDRVEAEARRHHATAVRRIRVRIGALAGVEPDLLASAYDLCRAQVDLCAAAELAIETVPTSWRCPRCAAEIPAGAVLRCVTCDEPAHLAGGDEIVLTQIELEVP